MIREEGEGMVGGWGKEGLVKIIIIIINTKKKTKKQHSKEHI